MLYKCLAFLLFLMSVPETNQLSVLHLESLEYPRLAWQARIEGNVKVAAHIGLDGKVSSASASSGHQLLQKAALENIKKWIFVANHGSDVEIIYQFELEKPESSSQHATKVVIDLPTRRVIVICSLPQLET